MSVLNISPTRMELTKIKKRLAAAVKGHKLLKDKRDELMRRFLDNIRETRKLRIGLEEKLAEINRGFALAGSVMRREALASALLLPKQSVTLKITSKSVTGVELPVFETQKKSPNKEDALSYGYAFTGGDLDRSILTLSDILPDLLRLAEQEKAAQILSAEIEKTRRRVNALEYVIIPDYRDTVRYIKMRMAETERSNTTRLMKVKDMMIAKQIESRRTYQPPKN